MYLNIIFEYHIVVGSNSIRVTEYKFIKVASVIREAVLAKEVLDSINANRNTILRGREFDDIGSSMFKGCSLFH